MKKQRVSAKTLPTHETPSGLGGVFSVAILATNPDGTHLVQVINKQSDFHGCVFNETPENLTEIKNMTEARLAALKGRKPTYNSFKSTFKL